MLIEQWKRMLPVEFFPAGQEKPPPLVHPVKRAATAGVQILFALKAFSGTLLALHFMYLDKYFDVRILLHFYASDGMMSYFAATLVFLLLPHIVTAIVSVATGQGTLAVVASLVGVKPALDAYHMWAGTATPEGQLASYGLLLGVSKLAGVLCTA